MTSTNRHAADEPMRYTRFERDGEYYVALLGAVIFGLALGALIVALVVS
jgi:hypothetical protein